MGKKYPFETMTVEEMVQAANAVLKESDKEMTPEEIIEYDAKYGYFQDDED